MLEENTRTKNAMKNIIITLLAEFLQFFFGIVVPRLIILRFGSMVNGLTTTIVNILNIINLIQAGAVGASIYEMYAPISQNDYQKVSNILYSSKKYFEKLGLIFITVVLIISPFVAKGQMNSELSFWEIELSLILLGTNGLFSFFFFSWYDILFCSHQKKFYVSIASIGYYVVYYGLVFLILSTSFLHFTWLYIAAICGNIIKLIILYYIYNKKFSTILVEPDETKQYPINNRYHLLVQQIATQGIEAVVLVLFSFFYGLQTTSVYSIYNMVRSVLSMILFQVLNSVVGIMGNVVHSESKENVEQIYDSVHLLFSILGMWLVTCAACLYMPFVQLYTKQITDTNYIRPDFIMAILIYIAAITIYIPIYLLANVYGYYNKMTGGFVTGGIVALLCGGIWGKNVGWMLALMPAIMYLIISIAIYRVLIRQQEWFKSISVLKRSIVLIVFLAFSVWISKCPFFYCDSWIQWILKACMTAILWVVLICGYVLLCERKMARKFGKYVREVLRRER